MSEHTPGPWRVARGFIVEQTQVIVCQLWDKHEEDFLNWEANARLISAAPDMYKSLKEMREVAACCFRTIDAHGWSTTLGKELRLAGIRNGFGVRATMALRNAEGK